MGNFNSGRSGGMAIKEGTGALPLGVNRVVRALRGQTSALLGWQQSFDGAPVVIALTVTLDPDDGPFPAGHSGHLHAYESRAGLCYPWLSLLGRLHARGSRPACRGMGERGGRPLPSKMLYFRPRLRVHPRPAPSGSVYAADLPYGIPSHAANRA